MDNETFPIAIGGHRGNGCTDAPFFQKVRQPPPPHVENTIGSFVDAYDNGCDYVECDAIMSSDGAILSLHNVVAKDHFFMEAKPSASLHVLPYAEIARYRTGPDGSGQPVLLAEVLEVAAARHTGRTPWAVNVELKGVQRTAFPYETNDFLERVAQVLCASPLTADRLLLSSFSLRNLVAMSHLLPDARYAMLFKDREDTVPLYGNGQDDDMTRYLPYDRDKVEWALSVWQAQAHPRARLDYLHPEVRCCNAQGIAIAADHGKRLNIWAFYEELTQDRQELYHSIIADCRKRLVPVTFITDYIPAMKVLVQQEGK